MPWYLHLALKQLFPSGRRFPFFTLVSVCGVMLGVGLLIIVLSVMDGFGREIREKIVAINGHVRVESAAGIILQPDVLTERLREFPDVAAASPYAQGIVMIQAGNRPAFPYVRGLDVAGGQDVVPLESFLITGSIDDLDDDSLLLSFDLASSLQARVGDQIEIYSPLLLERLRRDEIMLPREIRVAGIFQTGWNQVDSGTVVTTLRMMQELYGLDGGVHGVGVRLRDGVDADRAAADIQAGLTGNFRAVSWLDSNRDFLFILQLEKNVLFFLLLFIILVSAFAIASSLLVSVIRKTREIGLLGALGGRPRDVAACFCVQGLLIGVAGTIFGFGFGFLALAFRNEIVHAFARITQSEAALLRFYQFAHLPAHTSGSDLFWIALCTIILSTLAGVLPAWRAARLQPAEALRSE